MEKLDRSWIWNDHSPCQDIFGEDFSKRLEILYDRCKSKHGQATPQNHRRANDDDQYDAENEKDSKVNREVLRLASFFRSMEY